MARLSIGKIASLQKIANPDGIFTICAMDHRESLASMIGGGVSGKVSYEEMVGRKLELCSSLAKYASAVLLDPVFGAAQCISYGAIPSSTGLLVSIEASGYSGKKDYRSTELLEGWGVEKIKRMGATAVKLLVYYRPDLKELASKQLDTVKKLAGECIKYDIPYLVEPRSYPVGSEINNPQEFASRQEEIVMKTARDISSLSIDVLKAEFPGGLSQKKDKSESIELCRQLDAASQVPWVILSAGVDFETFYQQVEIACQAGASGFLGGRAIWQEAINIDNVRERVKYLSTVAVERLKRLTELANKYAVPWYKRLGLPAHKLTHISEKWYREY